MKKTFFITLGLLILFSLNSYAESYKREGVKVGISGPKGWVKRTGRDVTLGRDCVVQYTKNESPLGSPTLAVLVKDIPDARSLNRYLPGRKIKTAFDIAEYDIAKIQQMGIASRTEHAKKVSINGMPCATVTWEWDVGKSGADMQQDLPVKEDARKHKRINTEPKLGRMRLSDKDLPFKKSHRFEEGKARFSAKEFTARELSFIVLKAGKGVVLTVLDKTDNFDNTFSECQRAIGSFSVEKILRSSE